RLPAALGGVRSLGEPGPDRPRRHDLLRPDAGDVGGEARLEPDQGRQELVRRPHRRLDRLALGAADRQLRARGRIRAEPPGMTETALATRARAVARPRPRALTLTTFTGAVVFFVAALLVGTSVGPVHVGV